MSAEASNGLVLKEPMSTPRKRTRRRARRDANAPVQPANCFTRFMMARRPQMVQEQPELPHIEISKRIGEEWKAMASEEKEVYMNKASAERKEYLRELSVYKKTDSYKVFRKKLKKQMSSGFYEQNADESSPFDIPIFSKEFLELNQKRESELRRLRMEVIRLEEEEKAMNSNMDRFQKATHQLETELSQQKELTEKIHSQLDSYRRTLVQAFAHMPFPGTAVVPRISTIDNYMNNIHKLVLEAPGEHQDFIAKVRDIVTQLKMPSTPS